MGATQAADSDPRVETFRDTPCERGHSSVASETCCMSPGRPKGSRKRPALLEQMQSSRSGW